MQAIREKISDIRMMRKTKSDARQEQQADLARERLDQMAHEARLTREAEVAMGLQPEDFIQHGSKLTGDHMNPTGYGGSGLNNRHVSSDHNSSRYGGATTHYSSGTYTTSAAAHDARKMAIHHKYL